MAQRQARQGIPVELSEVQFNEFVLTHLPRGRRGPLPRLPLYRIFNYILKALYLGCQWHMLPIDRNQQGRREIHPTSIYRIFRRWQASGCFDAIFLASVRRLQQDQLLDLSIIHGDGTTTAAKKGGDNLGFSGHKRLKGCKIVAFCDRRCNVIAPFVVAPANHNESPMLREALPTLMKTAREAGLTLHGTIVSLDGAYDCRVNRRAIFNRGMVPNINPNPRGRKSAQTRPQGAVRAGHF